MSTRNEVRNTAFPRYEQRRQTGADQGWAPVDLGGHETVARLHLDLRTGPQAAGEGRHALDRLEGAMPKDQLDVLKLLITELLTNSIRHGTQDENQGRISLDVEIYTNSVRVAVTDPGPGFEAPDAPVPHPDRPGGWGLCLVDRLATRWGVARERETRVWFEMDRSMRGFATA